MHQHRKGSKTDFSWSEADVLRTVLSSSQESILLRHSQEFLVAGDPQAVEMEETLGPDGKVPPVLA